MSPDNDLILTIVGEKKRKYSQRQVEKADAAVALQEKLGWASTSDVLKMLKHNSFVNNPNLTSADFTIAKDIYGPSVANN